MISDKTYDKNLLRSIIEYGIFVFSVTFLIEMISRGSIRLTLEYSMDNTKLFLCNVMLVNCFYASMFLFKRRLVVAFRVTILLAVFSIVQYLLLKMRGTPLTFSDIRAAGFGAAILMEQTNIYVLLGIGAAVFAGYVIITTKLTVVKKERHIILFVGSILICWFYISLIEVMGIVTDNAWAQNTDYLSNGALYSFVNSYRSSKVSRPGGYGKDKILKIKSTIEQGIERFPDMDDRVNIVMIQVEAWMDPMDIQGLSYSEDPMPNLRRAISQYSSGKLNVNVLGGATVNTEFEVLTGLPIENRPSGEYPYLTVLTHSSAESLPFYLNENYQTTAIHNYYGDFYNRDKVFANIGFERYVSMETMVNLQRAGYYPSDKAFIEYIPQVLEESLERDFIYGITVEMHGPYATGILEDAKLISEGNYPETVLNNMNHYINALHKTDQYLGELFSYFDSLDEPLVCFVFGDHQPALELWQGEKFNKDNLDYNFYQVPYVCYNNMGLRKIDIDMDANRVGDYLLKLTKNNGGLISTFHDVYSKKEEYEQALKLLEYDILSGKQYLYEEDNPYTMQTMKYGLEDMFFTEVKTASDGILVIDGGGFNESCQADLNGKTVSVEYVNEQQIRVDAKLKDGDVLEVYRKGLYRIIGNTLQITEKEINYK